MGKKTALIILDGWGIGNQDDSDGVYNCLLYTSDAADES